jgi:hypothetical protein
MLTNRSLLLAAFVVPLTLVACGGGGGGDDDGMVVPEGTHHQYVVSKTSVIPVTPHTPIEPGYALDLGSKTSAMPDGKLDNQLGFALFVLSGLSMELDVQGTLDTAVKEGNIILLVDFQSKDFMNSNAGFGTKFGTAPNPPACNGVSDTTCGRHLTGSASFQIATNSPNNALLAGKLTNGTFEGGPGALSLQITVGSTAPILLPLIQARVKVTSVSATGLKALVGGAITAADLKTHVGGALQTQIAPLIVDGCTDLTSPPECGCTGLAATIMSVADGADGTTPDCAISAQELLSNRATGVYTTPDICTTDACTAPDAVSVGLNIEAVSATF